MFIDVTVRRNPNLIKAAIELHQQGKIEPDTYILDLDAILTNAKYIKEEADRYGIELYFMTKQFGRNPYVAQQLMELGYGGAVAVDYREANLLYQNDIKLGHVGHLVQIPSKMVQKMVSQQPEIITVYSLEKAKEISKAALSVGVIQKIMLRVIDGSDILYPAQYGGFYLKELVENVRIINALPNIHLCGLTSFPCFLFNEKKKELEETPNVHTLALAKAMLEDKLGINISVVNTPSATCTAIMKKIAVMGGNQAEPGHALTGTTPLHAIEDQIELPAMVYVSEVSHQLNNKSYCYGGGYYRRSHISQAIVGSSFNNLRTLHVEQPDDESIDYYLELEGPANVGETAVFAYRTQIFVTRSQVAVVEGISHAEPKIVGLYDSLGRSITTID